MKWKELRDKIDAIDGGRNLEVNVSRDPRMEKTAIVLQTDALKFESFADITRVAVEWQDYRISYDRRSPEVLVIAPHGKMEKMTSELAEEIAGWEYSFYAFESEDRRFHVTSHKFDEPIALEMAAASETILSIHGTKDAKEETVMIGGLDANFGNLVRNELSDRGFNCIPPKSSLAGRHPDNICNRGKTGAGVQLELSRKLCDVLEENPNAFWEFVQATRLAIEKFEKRKSEQV